MLTQIRVRDFRSIADSGDLRLEPLTVIVGKNNSGKSSLLRSIYLLQEGYTYSPDDLRFDTTQAKIEMEYDSLRLRNGAGQAEGETAGVVRVSYTGSTPQLSLDQLGRQPVGLSVASLEEPDNLIYPTFTGSNEVAREQQIRRDESRRIRADSYNLVSRMSTIVDSNTEAGRNFSDLCRRVLGLNLGLTPSNNGHRISERVSRFQEIGLDFMGTGVAAVLGLLVNLVEADGHIFLLEEPEDHLHPSALKSLLDVIIESSNRNQFIIATHSNIVVTKLCSQERHSLISAEAESAVPRKSTFTEITEPSERADLLRDLGYELADLGLTDGWIIFEESSAERICREYLIPWFTPELRPLKTIAAKGTSRVSSLVQSLQEMLVFVHREPVYRQAAWVIVDNEPSGASAMDSLHRMFSTWPSNRFLAWGEKSFESYYPEIFEERVRAALSLPRGKERQDSKRNLLSDVVAWIEEDIETARVEMRKSAQGVIEILEQIRETYTQLKTGNSEVTI